MLIKKEALAILETEICDDTQVIVDIYSRFLFEKNLFEKRKRMCIISRRNKKSYACLLKKRSLW